MTDLLRFLLRDAILGMAIGVAFTAMLLVLDVGHLRRLTEGSLTGAGVRLLLAFFIGSTFASLQMGIAVMYNPPGGSASGDDDDDEAGGDGSPFPSDSLGMRARCLDCFIAGGRCPMVRAIEPTSFGRGYHAFTASRRR